MLRSVPFVGKHPLFRHGSGAVFYNSGTLVFGNRFALLAAVMPLYECGECARLWAAYTKADATRIRADAELTKANFSGDRDRIQSARVAQKVAFAEWQTADFFVRQHRRSHVMVAGTSERL